MTTETPRTSHVHILDTGQGDWGAHKNAATALRAAKKALEELNTVTDMPVTGDELTIVNSKEWCAQDDEPCYHDRNLALIDAMRTPAAWTHDFPSPPSSIYRIDGKRIARWKMACSMSIDQAMILWPFTGHPVAIPIWRYEAVQTDPALCSCNTRRHRKTGCIIGPKGDKCLICGSLYEDYGNTMHHCLACQDWLDRRQIYLADWAAENMNAPDLSAQLVLL